MRKSLLERLVDPASKVPLDLEATVAVDDSIEEGVLHGKNGHNYQIKNGIPRFVLTEDQGQLQAQESFAYKWRQTDTYRSPAVRASAASWLTERYGFASVGEMREHFSGPKLILDAGCGSGYSSSLWLDSEWERRGAEWIGADISEAVDVAKDHLGVVPGTHFLQADLLNLPFREKTFDVVFCEGVMHHTPSTEAALKSLASHLKGGGEFLFYVYAKKAPMREFADDFLRDTLSRMSPKEAWNALRPLTRLGGSLASMHATVDVPEDIPLLGIKAGQYDLQRFVYWHFLKLFWKDEYSLEENNHVNFDWYHPRYAHRQTEDQVRQWCKESGLEIHRFDIQESGFTVRACKTT